MSMGLGNDDAVVSEINVTPLVDVMLVLLTIFIVTAPLLMNAVPVKLPKADASVAAADKENLRISITREGGVFLNDAMLSHGQLKARLSQAAASGPSVAILADDKVEYGVVAKVMATVQRAGIAKFSFVMLPEGAK
jgi:biopolymer transport protein ExbD